MSSQLFRYNDKELKVQTVSMDGNTFVLLEDVRDKFRRNIRGFTLEGEPLGFVLDAELRRLEPQRIRAYTDQVIDCDECDNDSSDDLRSVLLRIDDATQRTRDNTELIIKKADAILTQTYELAEFTVPRLFIILPVDRNRADPANLLSHSYRLFFLCECDKQHHVAYHEGYEINRPLEFFEKYGPHLRKMFTVVKAGLTLGSFILPPLMHASSQIAIPNIFERADLWNGLSAQIDLMDGLMDGVMKNSSANMTVLPTEQQLEGADFRKIVHFLKMADDRRTLGNLYRSTTDDGHVRWVCVHHYSKVSDDRVSNDRKRRFRELGGQLKMDVGAIDQNAMKKIDEIIDILHQGLPIFELSLNDCKIRETAFDKLLSIIKGHQSLRTLTLNNVSISTPIGTAKSPLDVINKLEHMLENTPRLETINYHVGINGLQRFDMKAFEYALENTNPRLVLYIYTESSLCLMNGHNNVVKSNQQRLLQTFLRVREATTIATLQYNLITELVLNLSQFDELTFQHLIKFVAKKNNILTLSLSFGDCKHMSKMISDICEEALTNNDTLKKLALKSCCLNDNTIMTIARTLLTTTSLVSLDLSDNSQLSFHGAKTLANVLRSNHNLRTLILYNSDFDQAQHKLQSNVILYNSEHEVEIKFDKDRYETYATLFLDSTGIEELTIGSYCCLFASMSLRLGFANTSLQKLNISEIIIPNVDEYFLNTITTNLTHFHMSSCQVSDRNLCCILSALTRHQKLQSLTLEFLNSACTGKKEKLELAFVELVRMIQLNTSLKKLNVTSCGLGNSEITAIAEVLTVDRILEELDVGFNNQIGNDGALALAKALEFNNTLVDLSLQSNYDIGKEGIFAMLKSLKTNKTLKCLNILDCCGLTKKKHEQKEIQHEMRELSHTNEFVTVIFDKHFKHD